MSTEPETQEKAARDAANWAPLVQKLRVSDMPEEAVNLVEGRRLVGPLQGFGKMWQKTYRVRLKSASVTPAELIKVWKAEFPSFWPKGNQFFAPLTGIKPGEVALISMAAGPMRMSTGVMVLYADDESFTLMTPEVHMMAGWITFSSYEENGECVAQTQVLLRAPDPLAEMGLIVYGYKAEDRFWFSTLRSLAARFGVQAEPEMHAVCVDPRRRWSQAKNVFHNIGLRSMLYQLGAPLRFVRRLVRRRRS